jgi:hypothetical protein
MSQVQQARVDFSCSTGITGIDCVRDTASRQFRYDAPEGWVIDPSSARIEYGPCMGSKHEANIQFIENTAGFGIKKTTGLIVFADAKSAEGILAGKGSVSGTAFFNIGKL